MKHTEEPWFVEEVTKPNGDVAIGIASEQFDIVCVTLRKVIRKMEDAERIVTCVNACAGIDDENLRTGYVKELEKENERLKEIVHNLDHRLITNGEWSKV